MRNLKKYLRVLAHLALWLAGSYVLARLVFKQFDHSVWGVILFITFLGANRTLGHFTFGQAMDDMIENARKNPQSYWDSSPKIGISPLTGESGLSGGVDSKGNPIP